MKRRTFLWAGTAIPVALAAGPASGKKTSALASGNSFAELEAIWGGRLGVCALGADGARIGYRALERFALCSTFKVMLVAAILASSLQDSPLLQRRVLYSDRDLVPGSPVTVKNIERGMSIAELCAAALQYSDNTAANLLVDVLGGPLAVTAYARSIGNGVFRLDRKETELNSAIPGDPRDTVSPESMAFSLKSLCQGDALPPEQRAQLNEWLLGNTTGGRRIRAAIPNDWKVGDKTGSGEYGTTNDVAALWPPGSRAFVLAIYYTQTMPHAKPLDAVIAAATRIVLNNPSFAQT